MTHEHGGATQPVLGMMRRLPRRAAFAAALSALFIAGCTKESTGGAGASSAAQSTSTPPASTAGATAAETTAVRKLGQEVVLVSVTAPQGQQDSVVVAGGATSLASTSRKCQQGAGGNPGMDGLPEDAPATTIAYIGTLCFNEFPGSEMKLRGKNHVLLMISPESRVHLLKDPEIQKRGYIVAKIRNIDVRDFQEWPHLKGAGSRAYVWVGPDPKNGNAVTVEVFMVTPQGAIDPLVKHAGPTAYDYQPDNYSQHSYAEARWEHPDHAFMKKNPSASLRFFDDGNSSWFNCDTGCCTLGDLW